MKTYNLDTEVNVTDKIKFYENLADKWLKKIKKIKLQAIVSSNNYTKKQICFAINLRKKNIKELEKQFLQLKNLRKTTKKYLDHQCKFSKNPDKTRRVILTDAVLSRLLCPLEGIEITILRAEKLFRFYKKTTDAGQIIDCQFPISVILGVEFTLNSLPETVLYSDNLFKKITGESYVMDVKNYSSGNAIIKSCFTAAETN